MTMWKHSSGLWQLFGNWMFNVDAIWAKKEPERGINTLSACYNSSFSQHPVTTAKVTLFQNNTIPLWCGIFSEIDSSATYVLQSFRLFLKSTVSIWCVASISGVYHSTIFSNTEPRRYLVPHVQYYVFSEPFQTHLQRLHENHRQRKIHSTRQLGGFQYKRSLLTVFRCFFTSAVFAIIERYRHDVYVRAV